MKTKSIVIVLALTLGLFTSCDHETIRASDEVSSLNYSIPDYSALDVSNAFNVYVTFSSDEEDIRIEANENLHGRIIVKRDGNALVIKLKKFTQVRGNATLNAYITTNQLSEIDLSGASTLRLENLWDIEDGSIDISGSSEFTGEVNTKRLDIDSSGDSQTDIFGNIEVLNADLSGSSEIRDFDLTAERLRIDLSGASKAYLRVNETIEVEASGASKLSYKGEARITQKDLSGASEIVKIDG
ncbi:head GIN domain-containing protein [Maribacter sp. 2308TA10-17]|uniref:head GIN domain-containing protein n=1 Tax=Maribacter sp. 2308TA10-17 TaxID=3386276 RepID=UPI0039BD581F